MKISAIVVCVNYADMLALGIRRWADSLDTLTVVTDLKDDDTAALAVAHGAKVHRTNVFYERGATFNKAGAMQAARATLPRDGWHLFFDADIVPPKDWKQQVCAANPKLDTLYGAWRHDAKDVGDIERTDLPRVPKDEAHAGWFQMFNSQDPRAAAPLDEFTHAGVYDSLFARRWPAHRRVMIEGLYLIHVGERDNWFGLGRKAEFAAMMLERKKRGGWEHERIA